MRVNGIFKPADYPAPIDAATQSDLTALFGYLCPGSDDPRIDENHAGLAITGRTPALALHLARLSRFLAIETSWCKRNDLRELAIQTVNLRLGSHYSFQARLPSATAAGIGGDLLDALPDWRSSTCFDDEQRLVIEYTHAVVSGDVTASLFAKVVGQYGEQGAIEFTTVVAVWSAWAMIINAAG